AGHARGAARRARPQGPGRRGLRGPRRVARDDRHLTSRRHRPPDRRSRPARATTPRRQGFPAVRPHCVRCAADHARADPEVMMRAAGRLLALATLGVVTAAVTAAPAAAEDRDGGGGLTVTVDAVTFDPSR